MSRCTYRQRVYDHRLRQAVWERQNPLLFPELRIPRSTLAGWLREPPPDVVTADCLVTNDLALALRMKKLERRCGILTVPGARDDDRDVVTHGIEQHLTVEVFGREAWVANNLREVAAGFRPVVTVMSAVGLVAAIVLVVLLVQSVVDDHRQRPRRASRHKTA